MHYLHTMIRVSDLNAALRFFCEGLGLVETSRNDYPQGKFTLVFLAAPHDQSRAKQDQAPLLELTYNWPDAQGHVETYTGGRNFGHLAYRVENIYDTCQHLLNLGYTLHRPPRDGHMAFVKSPDGISVELLQHGASLAPQDPWLSMANTGTW
jgi:lactoylglutathione lyase